MMLNDLAYRLRALFRRSAVETEMDDELRFHFEQEVNKYEKSGLSHEEAQRRARLAFGGMGQTEEECREARGVSLVENTIQDLSYGLRRLWRSPGFTVVAVLTLALGIGANTAIFSVVEGILLKPLPYPEPDRLVGVWQTAKGVNLQEVAMSQSFYFTYREQGRAFQDIGAYDRGSVSVTQITKPEQVKALWVTQGVLPILGVQPLRGRLFTQQDDTDGSPRTVILTYGYWQSRFGGAASAIGQHITIGGNSHEIIGVLPRSFRFLSPQPALVLPLQFNRNKVFLGNFSYQGVARLKPSVTLVGANADVARLIPINLKSFPPPPGMSAKIFEDARIGPNVRPFMRDVVGDVGSVLWVLMGTIGAVLMIACANVANLLLVRAEGRQQELAIRAALGAGRGQIARELLLESTVLGLAGGALGLAVAFGALRLLMVLAPAHLPRLEEVGIDPSVLLFTLAISLFSGILFGLLPVFKYSGVHPGTGLRGSSRTVSAGRERQQARNVLVIVQVALALVLLVSSGLMIRTFGALRQVQPGFMRPEEVLTLRVFIPDAQIKEPERAFHMQQDILNKIKNVPGVRTAAMASAVTMDGNTTADVLSIEDHPLAEGKMPPVRRFKFIAPGYFQTMGRRFVAGRDLTWADLDGFRPVVLISENLARAYWRTPTAALGKRVREGMNDDWREIVGVVGDEYDDGVQTKPPAVVYWPLLMKNFWGEKTFLQRTVAFVVRSHRTGSSAFLNEIQRAIWSVNPNVPLAEVQTLEEIYSKSMARTSFTLVMLAVAGGMALLLGIVGLYGVMAYSVSQRTREIGIRVALGAQKQQVLNMVVRGGFQLAAVGVGIGIVAALGSTRYLASLLYGVQPTDPSTFVAVSLLLIAVALLASYLPARQAAKVDPTVALRHE